MTAETRYERGFDKCGGCPDVQSVQCTPLDNFGREQHTFLKYVIDNYDALPDEIKRELGSKSTARRIFNLKT